MKKYTHTYRITYSLNIIRDGGECWKEKKEFVCDCMPSRIRLRRRLLELASCADIRHIKVNGRRAEVVIDLLRTKTGFTNPKELAQIAINAFNKKPYISRKLKIDVSNVPNHDGTTDDTGGQSPNCPREEGSVVAD